MTAPATFSDYLEATRHIAYAAADRLQREGWDVSFGESQQSCSLYLDCTLDDDRGETVASGTIRISDHADRHGSDITIRIDDVLLGVDDEDGEYSHCEADPADIERLTDEAVAAAKSLPRC